MECYISLNFTFNLSFYPSLTLNRAASCASPRLVRLRLKRTSVGIMSSSSTSICTVTQRSPPSSRIRVPDRNLPVLVPFIPEKSQCSRTLLGYWVGPDSEDGWGFVQAIVDEII
ncbi:hypothetical protein vseg_021469 [Gypsophila vaccaria]